MNQKTITLVFVMFFLLLTVCGQTALAFTENWVTDPANGTRICIIFFDNTATLVSANWSGTAVDGKAEGKGVLNFVFRNKEGKEIKAQADAEMKACKMDGYVSIRWSDGDAFDGNYRDGLREGSGVFKWAAAGRVYDGDWKAGKPEGYGIGKDASGKVLHDGQWKNGMPVIALKTDKVLGVPWGATDKQTRDILTQRPKTSYYSFLNGKDKDDRWHFYQGPFADFEGAWIYVHFFQDKMWMMQISWPLKENELLDRFSAVKKGLTERYGAPTTEKGKYLDSYAFWNLGGEGSGYAVSVQIRQNVVKLTAVDQTTQTHPFRVFITYYNQSVADLMSNTANASGSKDY